MKRTITVFYDNTAYTLTWLRALVWAKKEFLEQNVKIIFKGLKSPVKGMDEKNSHHTKKEDYIKLFGEKRYDIVFLAYKHTRGLCCLSVKERGEILSFLKQRCNVLVWLDTADSTGTCMFDVMPYVDVYLKKQVLKNKSRYQDEIWGNREWCEYYHKKYGIEDEEINRRQHIVLQKEYMDKIGISWNVGLGDLFTHSTIQKLVYRNKYAPLLFTSPKIERKYDVHYRGTGSDSIALYQRKKTMELIKQYSNINMPDVTKKVPYDEYVEEVKNARCVISPFGWGEICTRDFEAFLHGATLIKMNMDHLITYPEWYISNKTYVSVDWDFENFSDVVEKLLDEKGAVTMRNIAETGQALYKEYMTTKSKKEEFVQHILTQVIR